MSKIEKWEEIEKEIDRITELKDFPGTLRKYGLSNTADEYLEMCGALKYFIQDQIAEAKREVAREIRKTCQTVVKDSDDWRIIATDIDNKYLKKESE